MRFPRIYVGEMAKATFAFAAGWYSAVTKRDLESDIIIHRSGESERLRTIPRGSNFARDTTTAPCGGIVLPCVVRTRAEITGGIRANIDEDEYPICRARCTIGRRIIAGGSGNISANCEERCKKARQE